MPIFVSKGTQFLSPSDYPGIYNTLLNTLNSVVVTPPNGGLSVSNINLDVYYRAEVAFKFYFSTMLPKNSLNLVSNFIQQAFVSTNKSDFY